jgi:hypothetical protein
MKPIGLISTHAPPKETALTRSATRVSVAGGLRAAGGHDVQVISRPDSLKGAVVAAGHGGSKTASPGASDEVERVEEISRTPSGRLGTYQHGAGLAGLGGMADGVGQVPDEQV